MAKYQTRREGTAGERITIKIAPALKEQFREIAAVSGMTLSAWLISQGEKELKKSKKSKKSDKR